jgi:nitrogen regulatory protein P-II 1
MGTDAAHDRRSPPRGRARDQGAIETSIAIVVSEGKAAMKLIIAIIPPNRLEAVKTALAEVEVFRLTVMDVQGFGRQRGHTEVYRGHEFSVNLLRKVQLMIGVNDEFLQPTIDAIIKGSRTGTAGEVGDGKIFVLPLEDCIRIRTGERGGEAI